MSNNQIDLNHLAVFMKIVEAGSLTAAAKVTSHGKSRLSRILSELEHNLGYELVYRTTRQFQLTEAGKELYRRSQPALLSLQRTSEDFKRVEGPIRGHIRMTGAHGIFSRLISSTIEEFQREHSQVTFSLAMAQQSLDLVKEGIDLAMRIGQPKDSQLRMKKIGEYTTVLVASPRFLEKNPPINFKNINAQRFLMLEAFQGKSQVFTNGNETQEINPYGFLTCNSPDILLDMTIRGLGICRLPRVLVNNHIQTRELIEVMPGWSTEPQPIVLLFAHRKKIPPHIRALAQMIEEKLTLLTM